MSPVFKHASLKASYLLFILLAATIATGADTAEIVVPANIERSNINDIYLSDLVTVRGVSVVDKIELERRLGDVRMGGSDQGRVVFSQLAVEMALKEALSSPKTLDYRWDLKVPGRVQVVLKAESWSKESVELGIRKEIQSRCPQCRVLVRQVALPKVGKDDIKSWELQLGAEVPRGQFSVQVHIIDAQNQRQSHWVSGVATIFNTVAVLKTSKGVGEAVRPEEIEVEERDVTYLQDLPAQVKDIETSVTARPIGAQQILTRSMLRREWAVKINEPVQVRSSSGGVTVSIDGIAQDQAQMGSSVRVKLPKSQKIISGIASEKGVVEIKL